MQRDVSLDLDEQKRLVGDMGNCMTMILRNHGLTLFPMECGNKWSQCCELLPILTENEQHFLHVILQVFRILHVVDVKVFFIYA